MPFLIHHSQSPKSLAVVAQAREFCSCYPRTPAARSDLQLRGGAGDGGAVGSVGDPGILSGLRLGPRHIHLPRRSHHRGNLQSPSLLFDASPITALARLTSRPKDKWYLL